MAKPSFDPDFHTPPAEVNLTKMHAYFILKTY